MFNVTPDVMEVRVVGINCQIEGVSWVGVEAKPIVCTNTSLLDRSVLLIDS